MTLYNKLLLTMFFLALLLAGARIFSETFCNAPLVFCGHVQTVPAVVVEAL
jgi:hypothetical protein